MSIAVSTICCRACRLNGDKDVFLDLPYSPRIFVVSCRIQNTIRVPKCSKPDNPLPVDYSDSSATMHFGDFFCILLLCVLSTARPSPHSTHIVHERRAVEPRGWVKSRRLEADRVLPMRFGLSQSNLHNLEEMLMSVSHPSSPSYGQHFTPLEVVNAFAPSEETISAVISWLTESGLGRDRLRLTASKGWVEVNATTAEIEELLQTEYHVFTHPSGIEQISELFW